METVTLGMGMVRGAALVPLVVVPTQGVQTLTPIPVQSQTVAVRRHNVLRLTRASHHGLSHQILLLTQYERHQTFLPLLSLPQAIPREAMTLINISLVELFGL